MGASAQGRIAAARIINDLKASSGLAEAWNGMDEEQRSRMQHRSAHLIDSAFDECEDRDYSPTIDVTAGELRANGARGIDDHVPDCAWVPRSAMRIGDIRVRPVDPNASKRTLAADFDVTFDEPFRWVEVVGSIE